jgi:peptidoglycan/LPS O-acetylase OafA/YrhL
MIVAWLMAARWFQRWSFWRVVALAVPLAVGSVVLRQWNQHIWAYNALGFVYGALALLLLRAPWLPRLVQWHGFYVIARLSFGIYLNHVLILFPLMGVLRPFLERNALGWAALWAAALLLSTASAFVTFALVELPFLRMRDRATGRAREVVPSGTDAYLPQQRVPSGGV